MVVISLPHASLLHPIALRRPPGPQQSSFISAKQTRVAIPLPRCKCSKRGFSGMLYPTARPKPETPLSIYAAGADIPHIPSLSDAAQSQNPA